MKKREVKAFINRLRVVDVGKNDFAFALLNADAISRKRGDKFGLCDCIDNCGNPYPSQWLSDLLFSARTKLGLKENITDLPINEKWSTAKQWE